MSRPIDLARLPAPAAVEELDYETILAALWADLRRRAPDLDTDLEADPLAKLLEVFAYRELVLRQRVNDACRAVLLATAGGADLDQVAALLGVARQAGEADDRLRARAQASLAGLSVAGPAEAYRRLALAASPDAADAAVASPAAGAVTVTVLPSEAAAADGAPLQLDSLPPAQGEVVRMLIQCGPPPQLYQTGRQTYGQLAAGSDAIVASGVTINRVRWGDVGGAENAVLLNIEAGTGSFADWFGAGKPYAGKSVALHDGAGGVEFAAADTRALGGQFLRHSVADSDARAAWMDALADESRVLLVIADQGQVETGQTARSARLLHAVRQALADERVRPMADRVTVAGATTVAYTVAATLTLGSGPDAETARAAAEARAQAYVRDARRLGGAVRRSALFAALHVGGVERVALAQPAADVVATAAQAPRCTRLAVEAA